MKILEKNLKDNYKKYGVCIVKSFFNKSQMHEIKKFTDFIKITKLKTGQITKFYEKVYFKNKKNDLMRAEFFYDYHKGLKKLLDSAKIKNYLKFLLGYECVLFKEKINYKPPGSRADKLHQDSQSGWEKYSREFISVLISVEKSTKLNGCLDFDFSGKNCFKLAGEMWKPLKINQLNKPKFKTLQLNVGDVVFFNSYVPHRSGPNLSNNSRCQIYVTYNKKIDGNHRKKYFDEKRVNYPPNNERLSGKDYRYKV
jgi:ectoine hydroxylase-related dioxygenase (phytanoyl-CoA dioxygenase family)